MATATFFPTKDAELYQWAQNFSARITASPTVFGLSAIQCTSFAALVTSYASALSACTPDLRSKSAVTSKNFAREALKTNAKLLASLINGQATVTDAQKQQLGLNVRAKPRPVPVPLAVPVIQIVSSVGHTVRVKLLDGNKRSKPAGVKGATILSYIGALPPADPSLYRFEGSITRNEADITFSSALPPGQRVYFVAFWFNNKMESGVACSPVGANLPGSASMSMAA